MKFPFQILNDREYDVVGFGTNAVDYLIQVKEYPAFNSKVELESYVQSAGGEVASTMAGLRRLGLTTAYAGRFGDDHEGKIGLQSLIDEGVDVTFAQTVAGARTQIAFIFIDTKSGERTILWQRDKLLAYSETQAPVASATLGRVLHITPHDTGACVKMARAARDAEVIASMDIDNIFDGVEELLPLVDVCLASAEFPEKLLGIKDKKQALGEMRARYGCPVSGLTLGESGSIVLCNDTFIESPAFAVPGGCVDTTGAGDAFRTGFLYGMLSGKSVELSCATANAVAALKCRSVGARAGLPTQLELKLLLDSL